MGRSWSVSGNTLGGKGFAGFVLRWLKDYLSLGWSTTRKCSIRLSSIACSIIVFPSLLSSPALPFRHRPPFSVNVPCSAIPSSSSLLCYRPLFCHSVIVLPSLLTSPSLPFRHRPPFSVIVPCSAIDLLLCHRSLLCHLSLLCH